MELKRCTNCANGAWSCKAIALPEACLNCNFLSDGSPSEWKPNVATHADRIRAMTDEELVENFRDLMPDELFCSGVCPDGGQDSIPPCDLCRLKWLKQPAEGDA